MTKGDQETSFAQGQKKVDPKLEAAAKRAKEIFSKVRPPVPSSDEDDDKTPSTHEKTCTAEILLWVNLL